MLPFINFKPAELKETNTETYVSYYVVNPFQDDKLVRQRIRLNRIKNRAERLRYGRKLAYEINLKLYKGWNPFLEKSKVGMKRISDAIDEFLKESDRHLRLDSSRTYHSYCKQFKEFLKENDLCDSYVFNLKKSDARDFAAYIEEKKNLTSRTFNNYMRMMRTLWLWLIDHEYTRENIFECIRKRRVDTKNRIVIPPADRRKIMDYLESTGQHGFCLMCQFTFLMLIRPKECLQLRVCDIDLDDRFLSIPATVAKNHKERTLALPDKLAVLLQEHCKGALPTDFIFSENYECGNVQKNTRDSGRTWGNMRKVLDLPKEYQFYSLKDTAISEMLEAGVPAKLVQELADHADLSMTQKYVHRSDARKILAYDRPDF